MKSHFQTMNTKNSLPLFAVIAAFVIGLIGFSGQLCAQTVPPAPAAATVVLPAAADTITAWITGEAITHPWILTALSIMGFLRLCFKPLVSCAEAYVKSTPAQTDDEEFEKVEHSTGFRWFCWFLDFFGSVKIGPQFTATPTPEPTTPAKPAATPPAA